MQIINAGSIQKRMSIDFSTKTAFLLLHVIQNKCLQVPLKQFKQCQPQLSVQNQSNPQLLWIIDQVENGMVQLVSAFPDKVLTADDNRLTVRKGKAEKRQLWHLQYEGDNVTITNGKDRDMFLCYNPHTNRACLQKNKKELWQLKRVTKNKDLNRTCFIYCVKYQKMIDVPSSCMQQNTTICVWRPNYRFNQRWVLLKAGQVYIIKSYITGLNLDIFQQKYQNNEKVVQYHSNGGNNQFWMLEKYQDQANNLYRIYSFAQPEYQLGHDTKILKIFKGRSFVWRIDGYIPQ